LHARWSGPSVVALSRLRGAVAAAAIRPDEFHVIDLDETPAIYDLPELSRLIHGWGEAFLIRNGTISGFRVLGRDKHKPDEQIQALLDEIRG